MGVKLAELLQPRILAWEELKGKTLAIDFSNAVYQFLASIRQPDGTPLMDRKGRVTSHLMGIFTRFSNLLLKGIKPIIVFDGQAPDIKHKTKEMRAEIKREAEARFYSAKERKDIEEMAKYAKQTGRINEEMLEVSKQLIEGLGIPVVQAKGEAEAQCSYMAENKDAWAAASQDYDTLLFASPKLVRNLAVSARRKLPDGRYIENNPQVIELKECLSSLGISQRQLIILGILVGTDYNPGGVKGIGAKKALHILSAEGYEKKAGEMCKNAGFDLEEIFALFENPAVNKNYNIQFKNINRTAVKKLLVELHDFNEERVNALLAKFSENNKLDNWFG